MPPTLRFNLKGLFLATFWFAIAAYNLADYVEAARFVSSMARSGVWVCGPGPSTTPALLCGVAGVLTIFGRPRIAAVAGLPAIWMIAYEAYEVWREAQG